ncbi:hypothetical protein FRX94_11285 [Corynebacterium canis]|uniref:Uncharacterized protein n=1 Tax=Corynebacterium canis TaxID=679663 RepID=A0A5C5U595_9CORY|nr:hypothetical protein [Corynebacterium canis]TWT21019.1 hypothetical protein FRX94_11285 [Corynebacterium canis]WJY74556.1 hypothetical protein CCANI_03500 [Corynebacterium canis]
MSGQTITVYVVYPRYPDNTEPLGAFVDSEEKAREIDQWLRSLPGDMMGTWEEFEVEITSPTQVLFGVFTGTPSLEIADPAFWDPICYGVFAEQSEAENAAQPKTRLERDDCPVKFVLPFRLGWKSDLYFPDGASWPPDAEHT